MLKLPRHHVTVFLVHPEDGGSKDLRNFGILPHHYTVSRMCLRPRLNF